MATEIQAKNAQDVGSTLDLRAREKSLRGRIYLLFSFPDPVNEVAARTVAAGVVILSTTAVITGAPWLLLPIVYGFWARVLTGPSLSPLGQFATRVVAVHLPIEPRLTAGAPKRFAQAIGTVFSTTALLLWISGRWDVGIWLVAVLGVAAFCEAAFGFCLGCKIFAVLIRRGIVSSSFCVTCADPNGEVCDISPA